MSTLRKEIDQHLASGNWESALAGLQKFWSTEASSAAAGYVVSSCEKLREHRRMIQCRISILRSFTLEPAVPLLRAGGALAGIDITAQVGGFDTYAQQMLDPNSEIYSSKPDIVVLAVQTRDALPELWDAYTDAPFADQKLAMEKFAGSLAEWIRLFRSRSSANLIIHNFEKPSAVNSGVLDGQGTNGQCALIDDLNLRLRALASQIPGVYVLDYDALVSKHGRDNWHDERKWLTMRMPISADKVPAMAQEWLRFVHPLMGKIGKVLVTDLDNTLWGGVIGEDGMDGIKLGREYPGAAFRSLQRVMLDMHHRGILLAVASKNNQADALEAIEKHPEMLLRSNHFAALQIHWESKVESLKRIAKELNVGLDSLVFVDDNPAEREIVRTSLPEVTVIELPADSMCYAKAVRNCPLFERVSVSEEDRNRGEYYIQQRQREDLEKNVGSIEDFYYSLNQTVELTQVSKDTLGRVASLIKKTNQFNLTTRRHTEPEIAKMADDPDWDVYLARVGDRFGDNGIVGICITHCSGGICEIDTLLLSCRVIGRTVETAILHFLAEESRAKGISQIDGWFLPTPKNKPAETFYPTHKFEEKSRTDAGTLWSLNLNNTSIECPPWIKLMTEGAAEKRECAHA